ncbi:hypothetical protein BDAP_002208 [Binucleata daphniae]
MVKTNFDDSGVFVIDNNFNDIQNYSTMSYAQDIIRTFYEITNKKLEEQTCIEITLHECLYSEKANTIDRCIKTGLGSSCVFLISIVYALLGKTATPNDIFDTCLSINKVLSPKASGCDIASCIFGSNIYKKYCVVKHLQIKDDVCLLVGSFNKSTSTRDMINLFDNVDTNRLKNTNCEIIQKIKDNVFIDAKTLKELYKIYLDSLRNASDKIVLNKQYNILMDVYDYDIIGCGVSGSGGEDCVWCLVKQENCEKLYTFWKKKFVYYSLYTDLNGKTTFDRVNK